MRALECMDETASSPVILNDVMPEAYIISSGVYTENHPIAGLPRRLRFVILLRVRAAHSSTNDDTSSETIIFVIINPEILLLLHYCHHAYGIVSIHYSQ